MRRLGVLLPAALAIYGGYVMWNALARMTYYNYARGAPGPGFLPFWLALGLIILGLILTVQAVRSPMPPHDENSRKELREIGFVLAALAIALLVFTSLGFVITTVIFIVVIAHRFGIRSWSVLVPSALAVGVGGYALFTWLGVDLPRGLLKL